MVDVNHHYQVSIYLKRELHWPLGRPAARAVVTEAMNGSLLSARFAEEFTCSTLNLLPALVHPALVLYSIGCEILYQTKQTRTPGKIRRVFHLVSYTSYRRHSLTNSQMSGIQQAHEVFNRIRVQ